MNYRQLFLKHVAQTSPAPIGLEIVKSDDIYLYDALGNAYIDLIAGFSVANIGHSHPKVVEAVKLQAEKYMHLIVYGEYIQAPQVTYAQLLTSLLPTTLNTVYFTNSGAEATEGAMKLAKRVTGKTKIISCINAYHGSTQGALSIMGGEYFKQAFRPLLPDTYQFPFNSNELINAIDNYTACVVVETVQAESGIHQPNANWLHKLKAKCDEYGCLLIFDEIQAAFGRTGYLFAFEKYGVVPHVLLLGKALGGGMPLGAFISSYEMMQMLTNNPVLGHITTFGGHPVACAAGKAAVEVLLENDWIKEVAAKEKLLSESLKHPAIIQVRTAGLWAAIEFESFEINHAVIKQCLKNKLVTDWFLFNDKCLRFAPPLCISTMQLAEICQTIILSINQVV